MRWVLRSKIHKTIVTQARLHYVGSLTVDQDLNVLNDGQKVSHSWLR